MVRRPRLPELMLSLYAFVAILPCSDAGVQGVAASCPPPFVKLESGGCFWMSKESKSFEACQKDVCGPLGASLACVEAKESANLGRAMKVGEDPDLLAAWIGYIDRGRGAGWTWTNGCSNSWTNWRYGDPDEYCGGEDCAAMSGIDGSWMDVSCRLRLPCVCQYPGTVTAEYNRSLPRLRDDTCYVDCGEFTKWCSAWPFLRLYEPTDDVCNWEAQDDYHRGRGVSECVKRVRDRPECGKYLSYSVGQCRCNPPTGIHANCTHRQRDPAFDVFRLAVGKGSGAELVFSGQSCVYSTVIDPEYFQSLVPATAWSKWLRMWTRVAAVWLVFGIPCAVIMCCVTRSMCCSCSSLEDADMQKWDDGENGAGVTAYGPLIDAGDAEGAEEAAEAVNRWVFRGAVGAIIYGIALAALGATLGMHLAGASFGFSYEFFEALIMAGSKAAVARAALMVNQRLSPIAKDIAGMWVLVLGFAKFVMAITAFGGAVVFASLADKDYETICFAIYLFRWSLLLALPLQCISGVALWRVQVRASRYACGEARVNGWVTMLVLGNFGSGAGVWWAGYLDVVHEAGMAVAWFFVLAAISQLVAGVSLLLINRKVKTYFKQENQTQAGEVQPTQLGQPASL